MPSPQWWSEQVKTLGFPIVVCSAFMYFAWQIGSQIVDAHTRFLNEHVVQMSMQTKVLERHAEILFENKTKLDKLTADSETNGATLQEILLEQRRTTEAVKSRN